ncbi:MAG: hypothetical protein E7Z91_02725 [Cyanobacteria bacterium SIG30]|nr:hypothetical protein [Cyanobacteria bacterium SIG30]
MKICSVNFNNLYNNLYCKNKNYNYFGDLHSDCFVKSKNVAFTSLEKRNKDVNLFMNDLITKVSSPEFLMSDISNTIHKYSKHVNVKPMSKAPKEVLFSEKLQGVYCTPLVFDETSNKFFIPKKNRNFYFREETLKNDFGNISAFINAVHEFTHILQSEENEPKQINLFNSYIEENKSNVNDALEQVYLVMGLANTIEENIARPFLDALSENEEILYRRVENGKKDILPWLSRKKQVTDINDYVEQKVISSIKNAESKFNKKVDKGLLFKNTIIHFEKEIEAYENENQAYKLCLQTECPDSLLRIELYKNAIEALKQMKE